MRDAACTDAGQPLLDNTAGCELPSPRALIRPAKLCADDQEILCLVTELVDRTLTAQVFGDIPAHEQLHFELASGDRFEVTVSGQEDNLVRLLVMGKVRAGAAAPIGGSQLVGRRIRLMVGAEIQVEANGGSYRARLINLSQQGAGIVCSDVLRSQEYVTLDLPRLPAITARVQWSNRPRYGLAFTDLLTLADLAAASTRLNRRPTAPGSRI